MNHLLVVRDAGRGETPPCPAAKFSVGDVVKVRRLKHLLHLSTIGAIAAVVPPGFPPEYAWADATKRPRPLMITRPFRSVSYIVGFEGDTRPFLLRERDLLPSGHSRAEITYDDTASQRTIPDAEGGP